MRPFSFFLILLLLLLLAAGLGGACAVELQPAPQPEPLASLLAAVNAARQAELALPPPDLNVYACDYAEQLTLFSTAEIAQLVTAPADAAAREMTLAEAEADAATAFLLIQASYGAYHYFGGAEAFAAAEERVLQHLKTWPEARISSDALAELLAQALYFVQDGHFRVADLPVAESYATYLCPDLLFYRQGESYYLELNDGWWQVVDLAGAAPADYLRLTIAENGALAYGLFQLLGSRSERDLPATALLRRGGESHLLPLTWRRAWEKPHQQERAFLRYESKGIPIYTVGRMHARDEADEAALAEFIASGTEAAQLPVAVVDLRGNGGGSDEYPNGWFRNFTGEEPVYSFSWIEKFTPLGTAAIRQIVADYDPQARQRDSSLEPGQWLQKSFQGIWRQNDTLLLVLLGGDVASSGETMVQGLRTLENVLLIGVATAGCDLVPNNSYKYLPHSGIALYFGQGLLLSGGGENIDGRGILPDIWLEPLLASSRVAAFCDYYGFSQEGAAF